MTSTPQLAAHQIHYLDGRLGTWSLEGSEILNRRGRVVGKVTRSGNIELVKGAK